MQKNHWIPLFGLLFSMNLIMTIVYCINHEIIKRFENKEAIVFYLSDHGEEVFQTRSIFGHTSMNPSRPMLEIPFYIWISPTFRKNHGEIISGLSQQTKKAYNTEHLIHTIMDICDIHSKDFNKDKSLLRNGPNVLQ